MIGNKQFHIVPKSIKFRNQNQNRKSKISKQTEMSSFPVSCQNCCSQKREFYVFLECRHFICLSCCLFMANLQNLTVRCCHLNTKMSQQLVDIIFDEIKSRKYLKEKSILSKYEILSNEIKSPIDEKQLRNNKYDIITNNNDFKNQVVLNRTADQDFVESRLFDNQTISEKYKNVFCQKRDKIENLSQKLQKVKESQPINIEKNKQSIERIDQKIKKNSNKLIYDQMPENTQYLNKYKPQKTLKKENNHVNLTSQLQAEFLSPTFKQIKLKNEQKPTQNIEISTQQQAKQNYQYWKNYDTTKDRILAKLNHHQFKMKNLIKSHYS